MDHPTSEPTLTLQDIADLAQVKRPVVSMWRNRPAVHGKHIPFPQPVDEVGGIARFARADVVDYLERTGRGNNAEHRVDVAAAGVPDGMSLEDLVTLLCLRQSIGDLEQLSIDECIAAASEFDPDDELLAGEVAALGDTRQARAFIDGLVASSYGGADALAKLESSRAGRELAARDLDPAAVSILRTIVDACRLELDPEGAQVVSAGDAPSVVLALSDSDSDIEVYALGNAPAARALRRRMMIREQEQGSGDGPRVRLLSIVGEELTQALEDVDNVLIDLGPGEIAVVLGAASVLCDAIPRAAARSSNPEGKRAETLRLGGLAAALKLPRGLWKEAHRQALGVWVYCGGAQIDLPVVADLGTVLPADLDHDALATDLASAIGDRGDRIARAYRYGRVVKLGDILAGHAVVPPGTTAVRVRAPEAVDDLDRVYAATLLTSAPDPGFDVVARAGAGSLEVRQRPLGELAERKLMRMRTGSKIDRSHGDPNGTVRVLSADGSTDGLVLDSLNAHRRYPRATRTEPGDVVFCENPPQALVDETGGNLVLSPSRILRLSPDAGIGPRALAALINGLPPHRVGWKSWNVPRLGEDESARLEAVLAEAAGYSARLRARQDAVAELRRALIEGIGAGTVSLCVPDEPTG
ncbi:hypothetical protein [Nocardia sp. alder85J]|uniref:hypothetical protein n=1 Tax=Nocardia sp. alder85J TaxID=2862949 RepID=UPI001CD35CB6|nr:hypothetical protein [Nocardia sp. alder85J]MCX4095307.1 hypothetical protein [Nocardia sp. alder85J]